MSDGCARSSANDGPRPISHVATNARARRAVCHAIARADARADRRAEIRTDPSADGAAVPRADAAAKLTTDANAVPGLRRRNNDLSAQNV